MKRTIYSVAVLITFSTIHYAYAGIDHTGMVNDNSDYPASYLRNQNAYRLHQNQTVTGYINDFRNINFMEYYIKLYPDALEPFAVFHGVTSEQAKEAGQYDFDFGSVKGNNSLMSLDEFKELVKEQISTDHPGFSRLMAMSQEEFLKKAEIADYILNLPSNSDSNKDNVLGKSHRTISNPFNENSTC